MKKSLTKLVEFGSAPFPFEGRSYRDNKILLHIPKGFDPRRPAVMVLFFHGHRATLERDVRDRQQVPAQISASGMNAVLVAPQFAFDAPDSSVGRFSQPGAVARFVSEAAEKLAQLDGDPLSAKVFANMQIVIFGYSGGFMPTAYSLYSGGFPKIACAASCCSTASMASSTSSPPGSKTTALASSSARTPTIRSSIIGISSTSSPSAT